jgi:hypothetical protein
MIKKLWLIALLCMVSGSAIAQEGAGYPSVDAPSGHGAATAPGGTGTGSASGKGGSAQTCTESCNRSYDGCMDHTAAIPGNDFTLQSSNNAANNLIGGSSDCSDSLRSCLNTCGG